MKKNLNPVNEIRADYALTADVMTKSGSFTSGYHSYFSPLLRDIIERTTRMETFRPVLHHSTMVTTAKYNKHIH